MSAVFDNHKITRHQSLRCIAASGAPKRAYCLPRKKELCVDYMKHDTSWQDEVQDHPWIRDALDATNTGLWVITTDMQTGAGTLLVNTLMLNLLGFTEAPSPEKCYEIWRNRIDSPADLVNVDAMLRRLKDDNQLHEVRYVYRHPVWGRVTVHSGGRRISPDGAKLMRATGYHQVFNDSLPPPAVKLGQLSLACSMIRLGTFELRHRDGQTVIATSNTIWREQFGLPEGLPPEDCLDAVEKRLIPEDRPHWRELCCGEAWRLGHQKQLVLHTEPAGEEESRSLKVTYEILGQGSQTYLAACTQDITENVRRENMLLAAKNEAEAANDSKNIFLANMSHEIRTPMNGIMGMAYLALNTDLTSQQRDYIEKIHATCTSLLGIINDLLDFSKVEANRMELEDLPFQPASEIEAMLNLLQPKALAKKIHLATNIDPKIPLTLSGDALRLRQIVLNLGSNAVKFTEHGTVSVNLTLLEREGDRVRICLAVSDEGIGMGPEELARLFKPFSQADSTISRRFGGTGLGLALCQRLARLMGGDISVESTPGKGSTFRVELPFTIAKAAPRSDDSDNADAAPDLSGIRVLVAEDNDINREIIETLLDGLGVACISASNGKEIVDAWQEHHADIDLIFMDVQMPVMDGYAATQMIRKSGLPRAETVPIIAMTAYAMRGDAERSLAAGMNGHLTKPIDIKALTDTLKPHARPRTG